MTAWGERSKIHKNVPAKKRRSRSALRDAKTGQRVDDIKEASEFEITVGGRKYKLTNRGSGMFEVVGPRGGRTGSERLVNPLPHGIPSPRSPEQQLAQKRPSLYAYFYLQEDDALKVMTFTKAMIDYLAWLGYSRVKIVEVSEGSIRAGFRAWMDGEDYDRVRKIFKAKAGDTYQYAEQWAKDAFVNKQQAEVTSLNVGSAATMLEQMADSPNGIMHVGPLLVLKVNGTPIVKQLSVPEQQAIEKHSGILADPAKAIENLALVVAGGTVPQTSEIG